jgi:hypothetical protein
VILCPTALYGPVEVTLFITVKAGEAVAGIISEDVIVTTEPLGGVPLAVPVLEMDPAFTSACVVV